MRTFCFESDIGSLVGGDNKSFAAMGGGFITKTVFEEGCVSVRWHIERRKRLAKGECSFLSECRQAAELARTGHMARFICARMEMRTHHTFMVGLRAKFVTLSCPPA